MPRQYRFNMAYLLLLNKKHENQRVSMGKSSKIIDKSMAAVGTVFKEEEEGKVQQGEGVDDNAFRDLTDLDNEDFVYVY